MSLHKFFQNSKKIEERKESNVSDPRPDLKEDSSLWLTLLGRVDHSGDDSLLGTLLAVRCEGATLEEKGKNYVIRPVIDPTGYKGWRSQKDYAAFRDKWMEPYRKKIADLLKTLKG